MFYKINRLIMKYIFRLLILLIINLIFVGSVHAASISMLPASDTVSVGNIISLKVFISTDNKSVNNTEASIRFPIDLLDVLSITKSSSIFTLWVEEPSFSNNTGKITFNGGLPNPGYNGQNGYVATITFKAKKQGTASIIFTDGVIRENDGMGTDITSSKTGATITINNVTVPVVNPVVLPIVKPEGVELVSNDKILSAPIITSVEMPDEEAWYSFGKVTFYWNLPKGVTAVQTLIDSLPNSTPRVIYNNPIDKKEIKDLSDGIHYLHVRFKNSAGWGKTAHRRINIDITGPTNLEVASTVSDENIVYLMIMSKDLLSGLNKYKISGDGIDTFEVVAREEIVTALPSKTSGLKDIRVVAYDKAGNINEKVINIEFPLTKDPIVEKYAEEPKTRENILGFINNNVYYLYILLILLLLILIYIAIKVSHGPKSSKKLYSDLEQTEEDIRRVFRIIKEDIKQSFKILKAESIKKKLSEEDVEIFETLSKDIEEAENYFIKKIKNIEKNDL